MSPRKPPFEIGGYYHIYSRGIDKCATFLEEEDYWRFILNLHITNRQTKMSQRDRKDLTHDKTWELPTADPLVDIVAYCLMPNHFHLILKEIGEDGISTFMQRFITSYTMYFKKKYKRSGGLFTRPFRSRHIRDESYLLKAINYIHANPTELICKEMNDPTILPKDVDLVAWKFSSLPDYIGHNRPQRVLVAKALP